ncbi:hypothetical protein CP965_09040 [Halarcobacter mediterraneus]|uniref:Uncharacterized protein n=1 Tax=Halarcobacter mediterraneus TaxID=2023153 RepID=A0A4Q1AV16_9BACT|nr:hypothetical protein [Halarcobacter mediterraneus]RXK12712.1 hypothetical protein CP965_09040 [Halarcobacter mediterraneus]|eukprot:gnl/Chilomastix_cuspidata/7350.p1 GENE.gnl/Chilomastix_cuspidata/7350~~gnl/Chilomastix_cuspidata/7350.p1  ORF type:complete len:101 (-),score=3.68 gnl/Chilomastix_cuspidata/7350:331-633(-)
MCLLIPVDSDRRYEALLTTLDNCKYWAFIELDEGRIVNCKFHKNKEDVNAYIETVVVENDQEYVWQFQEENMTVLVAPTQRSIDEIVEAYLLNTLHEIKK